MFQGQRSLTLRAIVRVFPSGLCSAACESYLKAGYEQFFRGCPIRC